VSYLRFRIAISACQLAYFEAQGKNRFLKTTISPFEMNVRDRDAKAWLIIRRRLIACVVVTF